MWALSTLVLWPCRKIGQGHSRVIIWTNYDGQESPMLHTKFRGNRPASSREDFWRVFTIYGRDGHLGHVTQMPWTNFCSPYPRRLHIKFGFDHQAVSEKNVWNCGRGRRRRTDAGPCVYYKLSMSLLLRWAKNYHVRYVQSSRWITCSHTRGPHNMQKSSIERHNGSHKYCTAEKMYLDLIEHSALVTDVVQTFSWLFSSHNDPLTRQWTITINK